MSCLFGQQSSSLAVFLYVHVVQFLNPDVDCFS